MIEYSAARYTNMTDATAAAERLAKASEHYPQGNYVEIRKVETKIIVTMVERFEAEV